MESTNAEKSTLEESLTKTEIQVSELENKIMELKVGLGENKNCIFNFVDYMYLVGEGHCLLK